MNLEQLLNTWLISVIAEALFCANANCLVYRCMWLWCQKKKWWMLHQNKDVTCQQGCGAGGKMSDSDLSKISDSDSRLLTITWTKFGCQQFCSNKKSLELVVHSKNYSMCFNKSLKRNCTISTGISNFEVWYKKWFSWTSAVGVGQNNPTPTPTPSVLRNPNRTTPKNLRLRNPACHTTLMGFFSVEKFTNSGPIRTSVFWCHIKN